VVSAKTNAWKHSLACLSVEVDNARQGVADSEDETERDLGGYAAVVRTSSCLLQVS
jgi:hypothetical protein